MALKIESTRYNVWYKALMYTINVSTDNTVNWSISNIISRMSKKSHI